jgi:hypothetical protein
VTISRQLLRKRLNLKNSSQAPQTGFEFKRRSLAKRFLRIRQRQFKKSAYFIGWQAPVNVAGWILKRETIRQ